MGVWGLPEDDDNLRPAGKPVITPTRRGTMSLPTNAERSSSQYEVAGPPTARASCTSDSTADMPAASQPATDAGPDAELDQGPT